MIVRKVERGNYLGEGYKYYRLKFVTKRKTFSAIKDVISKNKYNKNSAKSTWTNTWNIIKRHRIRQTENHTKNYYFFDRKSSKSQMFTLPKLTYKFKVIIIKTSSQFGFFFEIRQANFKVTVEKIKK